MTRRSAEREREEFRFFAGGVVCEKPNRRSWGPTGTHVTQGISSLPQFAKWPWGITYGSILVWKNIHLPPILMFTRGYRFGFDPQPNPCCGLSCEASPHAPSESDDDMAAILAAIEVRALAPIVRGLLADPNCQLDFWLMFPRLFGKKWPYMALWLLMFHLANGKV